MRIEDLTPYVYSKRKGIGDAVAVGWLGEDDLTHKTGKTPVEVIKILKQHKPQNLCRGVHMREYCDECGIEVGNGNGELWVMNGNKLFIAPYLIIHYMEEHNYKPPKEFIDSVLNGFMPHSLGYEMKLQTILK